MQGDGTPPRHRRQRSRHHRYPGLPGGDAVRSPRPICSWFRQVAFRRRPHAGYAEYLDQGRSGWRPVFRCLLTQTTRDLEHAHPCGACRGGLPPLASEMINRVAYAELWGATPSLLDRTGPAARDIAAIADEIDGILGIKRAA